MPVNLFLLINGDQLFYLFDYMKTSDQINFNNSIGRLHLSMPLSYNMRKILNNDVALKLYIGLMQKYPPIFKKMVLNDVALLWMRGFHAYDTASVSS